MRLLSRLLAVLSWIIAGAAVLLAALALATAFPAGRATIAGLAAAAASAATGLEIEAQGLHRLTPTAIDLDRIRVASQGQPVAALDGLHVRLRWTDLLRGHLRPTLVHLDQLAIERLPPQEGGDDTAGGWHIALPLLPAEAIRIDRVRLAEPVLGQAAELRLVATETAADGGHAIAVELQRTDRPGDGLTLHARYRPETATLEINAAAAEAPGGLLAQRLGAATEAAFRAELAGAGPLEAWRGRLRAELDGIASIAAELGIDKGVGAIAGEAKVEPAWLPDLAPLLREPINYRARLRWTEAEGLQIDASRLRIADIALGVTGKIAADLTEMQLQVTGDLALGALAPLAGVPLDGTAGFLLHAAGPMARPAIAGDLALSTPRIGAIGLDNALFRVETRADRNGWRRLELSGSAAGLTGIPAELEPLLAGRLDLDAAAEISATADEIRIARLSLQGAALSADGDGVLRPVAGESRGRVRARVEVPPGAGPVTGGQVVLELSGAAELPTGRFRAEASLQSARLALADETLGRLLGATPSVSAIIAGAAGVPLRVEQGRVRFAAGEIEARGTFDPGTETVALDVSAQVPALASLSGLIGQPLSGRGTVSAHLSGPAADPAARGKIEVAGLALSMRRIERGELSFDLRNLVSGPQGPIAATIRAEGAEYRLATNARLRQGSELELAKLVAAAPGLAANGDLNLDLARRLARGRIGIDAADLAPAARMAGLPLAGRGRVALQLDAVGGRQQATGDISGESLRLADTVLGRLEGRIRLDDALGKPRGELSLVGRDVAAAGLSLSRWQLAAQGDLARATYDLSLSGEAGGPLSVRAAGDAGLEGARWQVGLRSFEARHRDIDIKLDAPTMLRGEAGNIRLAATEVTVAGTKLSLAGGVAGDRVDGHVRTGSFPLTLLQAVEPDLPLRGHVDIDITASGAAADPRIVGAVRSTDLRLPRGEADIALELNLELGGGRLAGRAAVSNLADRPLTATVVLPMRLSLVPWRLDWSPDGPIEGRLDGNLDLARLLPPFIPEGDSIKGVAELRAELGGTLSRPAARGAIRMSGGRYESAIAEAAIGELSLEATGDGDTVRLAARGTDGDGGTATLDGTLGLRGPERPVTGTLALRNFWVARRADASVRMAGDINLAGSMAAPRLAGKLTIQQADLYLPEQLPPDVVKLDVVEINRPAHLGPVPGAAMMSSSKGGPRIGLDVAIGAERRVFVRGRGLESEWRGNLRLRGDTQAPDIAGTLEAISGRLDFIGQRFVLTKGRLLFPGGTRIDPDLDVATELSRGDITAIVTVGGTLSAPSLALSARPDMPPEEVISRIMFQQGTARLTPLQAVQVAQSVVSLSGGGSGPGVVDRLRRTTGLDVLDFESGQAEGEAGAVSVGKYVSDKVLLRAEKGFDATGPRAGIELEVTPYLSLESKVGTNASTSLGVKLKKDY